MKDGFLGFLCGICLAAIVVAIASAPPSLFRSQEIESAAAPEAAPFPEPPSMPFDGEYSAVWIPGHWRPLADGEVITEPPALPKTPRDRRPGESFEEWERRIRHQDELKRPDPTT
jgi:hypothetical protein